MSEENTELNQTPVTTPQPTFSKEDLEKSFAIRLQKEREKREATEKENAQFKAKLDELEKKVSAGNATTAEQQQYYESNKASQDAGKAQQSGMMTQQQADQYVQHTMNMNNTIREVTEASEKDPEFKDLIGKSQLLSQQGFAFIANMPALKNKTAIIKHLLKDEQSSHIFNLNAGNYGNDNGASLSQFVYNLGKDLESDLSKPGPSPFRPVPNLQDVGKSDDFDVDDYINNKY